MEWRRLRLKHLAAEPIRNGIGEAGTFDDPTWPRYVRTTDIGGPRTLRDDTYASLPPETARKAELRRGDIVMAAAGTIGKSLLYLSDDPACYAGYLVRFRPRADVDARFVAYWTESRPYWLQIEAGKVASTIENFSASKYQSLELLVPAPQAQRAIADFLDDDTARIDALIRKKRQCLQLLEERRGVLLENSLRARGVDLYEVVVQTSSRESLPEGWAILTLGRILRQLTNGFVGPTRDILVEEGIRYIQGLHIKRGRLDFGRRPFFVEREWHLKRHRTSLQGGDVLIVQTGDIGQVASVPADFGPANCHALLIARPNYAFVSSEFLDLYLNSTVGRNELLRLATGALHPHLEFGVRAVPVVVPPREDQAAIVAEVREALKEVDTVTELLTRQTNILVERRQALITAAVTGALDIPGAAT